MNKENQINNTKFTHDKNIKLFNPVIQKWFSSNCFHQIVYHR